jgi:ribulose-phosphate 3-epimerase
MISVSYLKSKLSKKETIKKIDESIADAIHVDLMDGIYVEANNFTVEEVIDDLKDTHKELDIHLMVDKPLEYISSLARLHPKRITFHLNISNDIAEVINTIKDYDIEVGLAINPDQDIHLLDNYIDLIDYVLIMSVVPGIGGQEFIKEVLNNMDYLHNKKVLVGIDGGINDKSINYLKEYNINNIISGSFVCMADDYDEKITILKNNML